MTPPAISFVAYSGTGKTTLIEKIIPLLKAKGLQVGVIKHDAHRFEIDYPGKDSHTLYNAGADIMMISSPEKCAMVKRGADSNDLISLLERYFSGVDIVLVEGCRGYEIPVIMLQRSGCDDTKKKEKNLDTKNIVAYVSDFPINSEKPLLDINSPEEITGFILNYFNMD